MRFFIIFILFFLTYPSFSEIPSEGIPEKVRSGKKAVWKIRNLNTLNQGTGFFTSPKRFVTNFHIIANLLDERSFRDILLSQEEISRKLKIKRIIAVSALHDLAILETEQEVSNYLSLSGEAVPQQEENLYVIGYPKRSFQIMKKTGSFLYQDSQSYTIITNYSETFGASGSPLLNEQGQVSGVCTQGASNFLHTVKISHLRNLLEQKTGLVCDNLNPKSCIKSEIENLKKLAKQGHAIAQLNLSVMYYNGEGVAKKLFQTYWIKQAAKQGHAIAQFNLGVMYNQGNRVIKNPFKAAYWFEKAALQDHAIAQFNLGVMYYNGEGVIKDLSKAAYWFKKAALQSGYTEAQSNLGVMYYRGEGVEKDLSKAAYWSEKAALQGHFEAQFNLAVLYYKGEGVEKDLSKAAYWSEKAALQGHFEAQFNLAVLYYKGEGVEKDLSKAAYWFKEAALQGHTEAQSHLAKMRSSELQQKTATDDSLDPCQSAMKK